MAISCSEIVVEVTPRRFWKIAAAVVLIAGRVGVPTDRLSGFVARQFFDYRIKKRA